MELTYVKICMTFLLYIFIFLTCHKCEYSYHYTNGDSNPFFHGDYEL